jgi:hypothetical protein
MRTVLVLLATVLALLTLTGTPAGADHGTVTTVVLATDLNFYPDTQTDIVARTVTLAAGESRHAKSRLEATSTRADHVLQRTPRRVRIAASPALRRSSVRTRWWTSD